MKNISKLFTIVTFVFGATAVLAADWSDTSIGYRSGDTFSEPFNTKDIKKDIVNFNHVSGYKYGTNFFNVDFLLSDSNDPGGAGSSNGAQEVYVIYRNTLDLEKTTGTSFKWGAVKGLGITTGFDANTKSDAGYNSKKQMLVLGPTVAFDVPGVLNLSLLALWESNAPYNTFTKKSIARYNYDTHPMLNAVWAIPLGKDSRFAFEGFANYISAKGKNESNVDTAEETNIDMQVMYDLSGVLEFKPKSLRVGIEYQYWKNKFGNNTNGVAGKGATAKTPMFRVEYHF
jgi:nucleoside-specific outer membrane channel protein Tsx